MKIIIRIIALPYIMIACLIPMIRNYCQYIYSFLRYGGEWISYTKTLNPKSIKELLEDKIKEDQLKQLDNEVDKSKEI